MDRQTLSEKIQEIITPITDANGAEIVRVKLMGHIHRPTVQIMAQRPDCTMDLGLCETLSREYSLLLDVNDVIPTEYVLEVSSPGIDRPLTRLKDFQSWSGFEAIIEMAEKYQNRRKFKGILDIPVVGADNHFDVVIREQDVMFQFPFSQVKDAQLTLSDELLRATAGGVNLHGFSHDDDGVEHEITSDIIIDDEAAKKNRKNTPRQKINSMNEIAEDVEITKTGEI